MYTTKKIKVRGNTVDEIIHEAPGHSGVGESYEDWSDPRQPTGWRKFRLTQVKPRYVHQRDDGQVIGVQRRAGHGFKLGAIRAQCRVGRCRYRHQQGRECAHRHLERNLQSQCRSDCRQAVVQRQGNDSAPTALSRIALVDDLRPLLGTPKQVQS